MCSKQKKSSVTKKGIMYKTLHLTPSCFFLVVNKKVYYFKGVLVSLSLFSIPINLITPTFAATSTGLMILLETIHIKNIWQCKIK